MMKRMMKEMIAVTPSQAGDEGGGSIPEVGAWILESRQRPMRE